MIALDAFPSRPVSVNHVGASSLAGWMGVGVGVVLACLVWWWQAEDLWRDYRISRNYEIAADATVSKGQCKTRKAIVTDCSATITAEDGARSDVAMIFIDFHIGDYETEVVRSRDDPNLLTLQLGVENIVDRIFTFLGLFGSFVAVAIAGLVALFRAAALKRAVATPSVMRPVVADVLQQARSKMTYSVRYRYALDGKTYKGTSHLRRDERLFFLDERESKVLSVVPATISTPVLLDDQLRKLNLSDAERAAIRGVVSPPRTEDIVLDRSLRW